MHPNKGETLGGLCVEGLYPVSTTPFAMGLRDGGGVPESSELVGRRGESSPTQNT